MLLHDKLKRYRLLLASHSPRRQQLLREAGIAYETIDGYQVEERYPPDLSPVRVAEYLSGLKSRSFPRPLEPGEILLTADTVVLLGIDKSQGTRAEGGELLGKPRDPADARGMLARLSGRRHTVATGVTIRSAEREERFTAFTDVWFRTLSPEEIDYYVRAFRPLDKAGAYGIQEWIGYAGIERIDGSFHNVMGLPVEALYARLNDFLPDAPAAGVIDG